MLDLVDIRASLQAQLQRETQLPCHVAAFSAWITADENALRAAVEEAVDFSGQMRHPEHVAALGYGAAFGLLSKDEIKLFKTEIKHLGGRKFFASGRPLRFEVDGVALLGVSLGAKVHIKEDEREWFSSLLRRSSDEVAGDEWQLGFVRAARVCIGEQSMRIGPPDLSVALAARGVVEPVLEDLERAWELSAMLRAHHSGTERDAVRLAVFDYVLSRRGQIAISTMTCQDLTQLLNGVSRSMRLWVYEEEKRTPKSEITRWLVENEYHVQSLLWTVLAPVLPDLEDEENLPSLGHKNPRADLCVPSLRTIIEVKFMRNAGQRACAKIIDEIAADASLYLSKTRDYDSIIAFVWDDCAQTEQHDELKAGIEAIKGVSAAVIVPRPLRMRKNGE